MSTTALELALKKQRLQIASESLRIDFGRHAAALAPVFGAADRAVEGVRWVRRNPQLVVAAGVALLVARPQRAWRWARRAFVGWQAWLKLRDYLDHRLPSIRQR
ncbi:MAG: YqjK-like family protein [Rhodocyclales bacterium]|nr:YqjK-like family protein [Rhodocyclales bacterium]